MSTHSPGTRTQRGARTKRAAAAPPSAPTRVRAGSRRTAAVTAITPGRSPSTPTTPTVGTSRRAPAPSPPTVAATRRHASTGGATANAGSRSPAASPTLYRRCPTRSSPPTAASSPASGTANSGRAATGATAGRRCDSRATRSPPCSRSHPRPTICLIQSPRVLEVRRPALLDPPKPPDHERDHPCSDKQGDDHEPEDVDVDVLKPAPEGSG